MHRKRVTLSRVFSNLTITAAAVLLMAPMARGTVSIPEQHCQRGRFDAAAKYTTCELKAMEKVFAGISDSTIFNANLSKCRVKYTNTWATLQARASGTGATCDAPRFVVSGGTVTDSLTGLQWERKTDDGTVHDKDNLYSWSATGTAADGATFTSFITNLNSGGCFAGQCDWRLPARAELETILGPFGVCGFPLCIDQGIFGPNNQDGNYWSSTDFFGAAWFVNFASAYVDTALKTTPYFYVRAVRGGNL